MAFTAADSSRCRTDFPALSRTHAGQPLAYLDGPAGTQVPRHVIDTIANAYSRYNANTHGQFPTSNDVDAAMERTRVVLADFLGAASGSCISLGANMTTLNYALSHAVERTLKPGDEVVVTELDHEANRAPWMRLTSAGIVVREIRLNADGRLDEADMRAKIGRRTRLVAIGYSSNALGTVNDIELARELTRSVGAWLSVDAVHYAPHFVMDVAALDPDFFLCSAYKFYGPHVGILYTRPSLLETLPTDRLPAQEPVAPYRIETGTLNHPAMEGAAAAVEYIASFGTGATLRERIVDAVSSIGAYEHGLAAHYYREVSRIPGVTAWGTDFSTRRRAPTVSITIEGQTPFEVATALGQEGICVWDGDFYAVKPIEVLGLTARGGVLRTGMSMYTQESDVERLLAALARLARR
jgi:cysteine desulfurase family protein (TIGR01976 family)